MRDCSRALGNLQVISRNSNWFITLFAPIGRSNFFGIGHLKTALGNIKFTCAECQSNSSWNQKLQSTRPNKANHFFTTIMKKRYNRIQEVFVSMMIRDNTFITEKMWPPLFSFCFCFQSCLHYNNQAFSKNLEDTIESRTDPSRRFGQRENFSLHDVQQINQLYNCKVNDLDTKMEDIRYE